MIDPVLLAGLRRLRDDLELYSAQCLKIADKEGKTTPFVWNKAQRYVHERLQEQKAKTGKVRALILKGRQQGISTYVAARFYHHTTMTLGRKALIVGHEQKSTDSLFGMVKRYHGHNPLGISTGATNAKELVFDKLDGGYKLATAGSDDVGRGNTAQVAHLCLAAGTLVLMADGTVRSIESLEPGDMVRTRCGDAAPVRGISCKPGITLTVMVAKNNIPLRATPEHKFWTRDGMKTLAEISVGDEVGFPVREITEEIKSLPFATAKTERKQGGGREMVDVPESIDLTFDVGRMLGLYLAEGHVAIQSKAPHNASNVVFACHERELERNTAWVGVVPGYSSIKTRANKGSKTRMTVAYGRQYAEFVLRMCGRTSGKHLPPEWWRMPREFVRGMLVGYLAGDGHCSKKDRMITAPSIVPAIAFGMRDVVASLGYGFPSIRHRPGAVRNGRNEKDQYTIMLCGSAADKVAPLVGWQTPPRAGIATTELSKIEDGYAWIPVKSIKPGLEETVWDIEVSHPDHDYCLAHCANSNSEFAFWKNAQKHMAGLGNTIADIDGTEIIIESTANGLGNAYHLMWQMAEAMQSDWIAIFVPWFWQDEYRASVKETLEDALSDEDKAYQAAYGLDLEQMQWRANKKATYGTGYSWLFEQEYPATPSEAFVSSTTNPLISPTVVMAAVNETYREFLGPLLIGCDPAGDGTTDADRTAIAFRQGRICKRLEYHEGLDTMQIAGKLAQYHQQYKPAAIFVDKGGLGAGVFDRLRELGVPVIGINSATKANDADRFENKRAEMWWLMRDWFLDAPVRIPNNMALVGDLTSPQPKTSSNGRRLLEKKEDMKKRGLRSPDGADALALTFAQPVASLEAIEYRIHRPAKPAGKAGY